MTILAELRSNDIVAGLIKRGNQHLGMIGYTDHGSIHLAVVSKLSGEILTKLGYDKKLCELAEIAGYLHDMGNVINRNGHSQSGALIAMEILKRIGMPADEIAVIAAAIGNHDEGSGHPISEVAAALILADKSHVHRNRVRNPDLANFDIHDRVNYAVESSILNIDEERKIIALQISIDNDICPVMDYFEIFLHRMLLCRRAANFLGCEFQLIINGVKLL
ncbi:MAG: HD domain-containing protein [Syntrophomonadaceae bacterium]|nr:HD domain-containing protein [Syntrophomonadaceae bacterium]